MEDESKSKKFAAAVILGRRGGLTKTEAKSRAARLNGLKGGARSWKKPRSQWNIVNKPGPKPKGVKTMPIKRRKYIRKTVIVAEQAPQ